jgi:DNA repair exonuclease SbcCD ATPase subunit
MEGFRGYPACCPLKLGYDVVIIFGDNGSGKSSLFNAIEWLLEGTVDLGDCLGAKTGDRFRNLFTECEEPWVRLTFSERKANRTIQYQATRRLKAGTVQTSSVKQKDQLLQPPSFPDRLLSRKALDEQGITYNWPLRYGQGEFEQVFLNRKRLGKFVEVKASERGEQLFKLLGYGILDEYHDTIDQLLNFLRQYQREEALETTFSDYCAVLTDKIESIFENYGDLPKGIQTFLSVFRELIEESREQIDEEYPYSFEGILELFREQEQQFRSLYSLTSDEQSQAEEQLREAKTTLENQQSLSDFFKHEQWIAPKEYEILKAVDRRETKQQLSELPNLLDRIRKFQNNPDMFDLEARLGFLEYGLALVARTEQDTCPFCLQNITGQWDETETVKEHFTSEHQTFLEKYRGFDPKDTLIEGLRQACDSLQTIVDCEEVLDRNQSNLSLAKMSWKPRYLRG